jgi:transposase
MSQLLLPIFPKDTKMITPVLGVVEKDGFVHYLLSGLPIYSHPRDDLTKFRYVTSNLLVQGLCKNKEIVDCFHVSVDSVRRWKKRLSEEGESAFFMPENRHGRSHKLLPSVLEVIQKKLDEGRSVNGIAREEGISEGSIRYAIGLGRLKKNRRQNRGSA